MKTFAIRCVVVVVVLCAAAVAASGDVPRILTIQGKLTDSLGQPVPDGVQSVTFRLYDVDTGGTALWQEVQNVQTNGGLFNANLGAVTPITLPFDKQYWLGMQPPSCGELAPRTRLTTAPYAMSVVDGAITTSKIADGAVTGDKIASGAITADKLATGISGQIGYAEITSNSAAFLSITDIAGLSVTVTVPAGGRKIKITVYATLDRGAATHWAHIHIYEGASQLQQSDHYASYQNGSVTIAVITPSAGPHTYRVRASSTPPWATVISATPTSPAFILVEVI